jgi:hypothetical protein
VAGQGVPVKYSYSVFGLRVGTNLPLKHLPPVAGKHSAHDLHLWLQAAPPWVGDLPEAPQSMWHVSSYRDERGEPALKIWTIRDGSYFRLQYCDGAEFILDRRGTEVWATWVAPNTLGDAATYLLGPIFGLVLRLRGFVTLHASAVAVNGAAIALLGPQGAGKSTTAAALARRGCAVLSDDIVAVDDRDAQFRVQPAYPQLNLWPQSVEALYGPEASLPPMTPNWDKRYLDLRNDGYRFEQDPLPLAAVYYLGPRSADPAAPSVHTSSPRARLVSLIGNGYVTLPVGKSARAREFDVLGQIAARVPVRDVTPHADATNLDRLCDVILDDCRRFLRAGD